MLSISLDVQITIFFSSPLPQHWLVQKLGGLRSLLLRSPLGARGGLLLGAQELVCTKKGQEASIIAAVAGIKIAKFESLAIFPALKKLLTLKQDLT